MPLFALSLRSSVIPSIAQVRGSSVAPFYPYPVDGQFKVQGFRFNVTVASNFEL
jgi:hypothetical protein